MTNLLAVMASDIQGNDPNCARQYGRASLGVSAAGVLVGIITLIVVIVLVTTNAHKSIPPATSCYDNYNYKYYSC